MHKESVQLVKFSLLEKIKSPEDLQRLGPVQLERLCGEIRAFLVRTVSKTGGHLASNLGAVELTVAMHRVFHSPMDQFVWDVGHQSYTHKILTGRMAGMDRLRKKGGISGFTKTTESVHDSFISGHSSTSLSVADGLAKAKRAKGEEGHVVAVIGDGAFTGGMTLEGLNNAARGNCSLIVILNDNHMSISKNVGPLSRYLSRLRSKKGYFHLKDVTKSAIGAIPVVGGQLLEAAESSKAQLKNAVYNTSFFEEMGYVHMGPVDGHDLKMLQDVLSRAKSLRKPVFIHVETSKGKGYPPAEKNPGAYHGVAPFDLREGAPPYPSANSYSAVFGKHLAALAERDSRICAVTAAMKYATGLNYFAKAVKSKGRFFDVGIAEQHAVTFCAALSAKGMVPVFAVYSSFLQRAYDQIIHDCSIEPRHVVLAVDRAGLVGEDGETHQGLFDCAFLTPIPGVRIYSPATYASLRRCLDKAVSKDDGVCVVRYPRGEQPYIPEEFADSNGGYTHHHLSGDKDLLIISYGRLCAEAFRAAEKLRKSGVSASVLTLAQVWPIDPGSVQIAAGYRRALFVEEGMRVGGIGEHFLCELVKFGFSGEYVHRAIDGFVPQAGVTQQMAALGLDCNGILQCILENLSERNGS